MHNIFQNLASHTLEFLCLPQILKKNTKNNIPFDSRSKNAPIIKKLSLLQILSHHTSTTLCFFLVCHCGFAAFADQLSKKGNLKNQKIEEKLLSKAKI